MADMVAEFHASRSEGSQVPEVRHIDSPVPVAIIPAGYGTSLQDRWEMASRIGRLLSEDAARQRKAAAFDQPAEDREPPLCGV